jgi:hypothetical protein
MVSAELKIFELDFFFRDQKVDLFVQVPYFNSP